MDTNERLKADQKFFDGLSDAERKEAEAIEAEIAKLLSEGLSEETGLGCVGAVLEIRKVLPEATVEGVLETILRFGLLYVRDKSTLERVRSVATGCIVSQDVAALKPRRKKSGVRGVRGI